MAMMAGGGKPRTKPKVQREEQTDRSWRVANPDRAFHAVILLATGENSDRAWLLCKDAEGHLVTGETLLDTLKQIPEGLMTERSYLRPSVVWFASVKDLDKRTLTNLVKPKVLEMDAPSDAQFAVNFAYINASVKRDKQVKAWMAKCEEARREGFPLPELPPIPEILKKPLVKLPKVFVQTVACDLSCALWSGGYTLVDFLEDERERQLRHPKLERMRVA